VILRGSLL